MRSAVALLILAAGCAGPSSAELPGPTKPFGGRPQAIPGLIQAEHYDDGRPGEAYHDVDEKNQGVDLRGPGHVDIEKRSDASNGHGIGWTREGEWLVYTVLVRVAGTYSIEMPVASAKEGGTFHIEFDGRDRTGPIRVPNTGSWRTLKRIMVNDVRLEPGLRVMRVVMDEDGETGSIGDIDYYRFILIRPR